MSRSYKHTPRSGEKKDSFFKRYFNHLVRRRKDCGNFNAYRKVRPYACYEICEYECVGLSFRDFRLQQQRRFGFHSSDAELRDAYERLFLRK